MTYFLVRHIKNSTHSYKSGIHNNDVIFPLHLSSLFKSIMNVVSLENRAIHCQYKQVRPPLRTISLNTIQHANLLIHTNFTSCCTSRLRVHKKQQHCLDSHVHSLYGAEIRYVTSKKLSE